MIELIQKKMASNAMLSSFSKLDEVEIPINIELVHKDIDRLHVYSKDVKNKYDKANIKALISYLEKLLKFINEQSILEICWNIKDDLPVSYPMSLINEKTYGINICNYIETNADNKVVEIDLTDLADIIAFEFIARDLGETHESIEELLKTCGILGFTDSSLLTDFFKENGDDMYNLSKTMKIDDTPYMSYETHKIHDYFHSKEMKTTEYKDIVDYSCRYANTIIANNIMKNCLHHGIGCKLVMLNATNITVIVDSNDEVNIKQDIIDDISIRVFGRRFRIEPIISVF